MESTLQKNVRRAMDALDYNALRTAKEAGLGDSFVRDILRGRTKSPSADNLRRLAQALHTTPEALMGREVGDSTLRPVAAKVSGVPVLGRLPFE